MVVLEHYYKGWSRGFKSRYGGMETFIFQLHLLPVALHSVGNHNSTRVDEGRKRWIILATKSKARLVGEGGRRAC